MNKFDKYDIAAYVWPAYTASEERTRIFWPEGMGEWQSVRSARHKFDEDNWPRRPLWGYVDEADPYVMEMEIEMNKTPQNQSQKQRKSESMLAVLLVLLVFFYIRLFYCNRLD